MYTGVVSKPIYEILALLTKEPRVEVALPLAMKDWIRLRLKETRDQKAEFARRYGMDFQAFARAWAGGQIANAHSYEVERDYWEWEAAVTDEAKLENLLESLP